MDRVERYRDIVSRVIEDYASIKPAYGDIRSEAVIDRERDHYGVVRVGWLRDERVCGTAIHVDIIDGKIWIQYGGTDRPVAEELVAAGVPREDIVLAFHPADLRKYTGYGVG
jgi:hypothetical protein